MSKKILFFSPILFFFGVKVTFFKQGYFLTCSVGRAFEAPPETQDWIIEESN